MFVDAPNAYGQPTEWAERVWATRSLHADGRSRDRVKRRRAANKQARKSRVANGKKPK